MTINYLDVQTIEFESYVADADDAVTVLRRTVEGITEPEQLQIVAGIPRVNYSMDWNRVRDIVDRDEVVRLEPTPRYEDELHLFRASIGIEREDGSHSVSATLDSPLCYPSIQTAWDYAREWFDTIVETAPISYGFLTFGSFVFHDFYEPVWPGKAGCPISGYFWRNVINPTCAQHINPQPGIETRTLTSGNTLITIGNSPWQTLQHRDALHHTLEALLPPRRPVSRPLPPENPVKYTLASIDNGVELPPDLP